MEYNGKWIKPKEFDLLSPLPVLFDVSYDRETETVGNSGEYGMFGVLLSDFLKKTIIGPIWYLYCQ